MVDKELVVSWLREEGREPKEIEGEEGINWHLIVNHPTPDGPVTHIIAPTDGRFAIVRRGTGVAERHRKALLASGPAEFREFKFQLLRDLLLSQVQYRLQFEEGQNMIAFLIDVFIREDGLTADALYQALQRVHDASLLTAIHVRRAAGEDM